MNERDLDRERAGNRGLGPNDTAMSAGAANTPPFGGSRDEFPSAPDASGATASGDDVSDRMDAIAPAGAERMDDSAGSERLKQRAGEVRHQAANRINQTLDRAADGLETAANRLGRMADEQGSGGSGPRARAGQMAHSAADTMESVSRYLRDNDAQSLQRELERQVRTNPVQTLLIGVAAGWIIGKILR